MKQVFTLTNEAGNKLSCMFFEPVAEERPSEKMPMVIYMHGNAGCKNEALAYAEMLLTSGINICSFDFSGCGISEGEWVTLGWKEHKDLHAVITHLSSLGTVSKIALWGRSMGAATAIRYMADHVDAASCAVLDSGFSSFSEVVDHLAAAQFGIPPAFVQILMMSV